jgi:hypothetical protein
MMYRHNPPAATHYAMPRPPRRKVGMLVKRTFPHVTVEGRGTGAHTTALKEAGPRGRRAASERAATSTRRKREVALQNRGYGRQLRQHIFTHAPPVSLGQHFSAVRGLGIPTIKAVLMMSTDQSPSTWADRRFSDEAARLPWATQR